MQCKMICSSHSPLMRTYYKAPEGHDQIRAMLDRMSGEIRSWNPDLVVVFGCDHFNGFFLNCMPSFCLGTQSEALADVGGTPGKLKVTPDAMKIAKQLRHKDVDVAISLNMTIDHGFSQTMSFLMGELDSYPTLPIFVNSIAPPYVPFKRSRLLGEQLAEVLKDMNIERLLVIATGGMSHNPTPYYPDPAEAEPRVAHYEINGGTPDGMSQDEWLVRLDEMHEIGAVKLVDGRRTREDIRLNPELDKEFADLICSGRRKELDSWDNEELIQRGGIGFTELHTWVAANGLFQTLEPDAKPVFEIYAETLYYGIGYGAIHGGF